MTDDGSDGDDRPADDAPPVGDDTDGDDVPLSDLAERARQGRSSGGSDDVMDAFEEVEVDDVDVEELWDQLEHDRVEETVEEPEGASERDVRVIAKNDYCMRCQYFSAPPETRCTHERGEILELVDTEQFKVADCPILRGEEELENLRR